MQSKRRVQVLQKHLTATSVEELAWVEPTTSYSNGMFRPVLEETSQLECIVEGKIPNGLKNGTYYRNGPNAKFPAGASDYFHYFDGDGMIASFTFGSTVVFNHKWVQTDRVKSDATLGTSIYDFGAMSKGQPVAHLEGVVNENGERMGKANTALLFHHNRLFATEDADLPYPVDPVTLKTLGTRVRFQVEQQNHKEEAEEAEEAEELRVFTAHSVVCSKSGELIGYGCEYSPVQQWVYLCLSKDGQKVHTTFAIDLPKTAYSHDFAASHLYSCCFDGNLQLNWKIIMDNAMNAMRTQKSNTDSKHGENDTPSVWTYRRDIPGRIGFFPRHATSQEEVVWCDVLPFAVSHTAACYDDDDGSLVIVTNNIGNESFSPRFPTETPVDEDACLNMYRIDPINHTVVETVLWRGRSDFPTTNKNWQGPTRYVYAALLDYQEPNHCPHLYGMYKFDLQQRTMHTEIWSASSSSSSSNAMNENLRFGGEPLFVAKENGVDEDDGYVLVLVNDMDKRRTELRLYDAKKIGEEKSLIATVIPVGKRIQPLGTHGIYLNEKQIKEAVNL